MMQYFFCLEIAQEAPKPLELGLVSICNIYIKKNFAHFEDLRNFFLENFHKMLNFSKNFQFYTISPNKIALVKFIIYMETRPFSRGFGASWAISTQCEKFGKFSINLQ